MCDDLEREPTKAVLGWIEEAHGPAVASAWAWNCTPIPCGFPTPDILEEGLALALGEVTIGALIAKVEEELDAMMKESEGERE